MKMQRPRPNSTAGTRGRFRLLGAAAVVSLAALAISACGGSDNNNDSTSASSTSAQPSTPVSAGGQSATIGVENNATLGSILDDSQGRTVYLFQKDTGTTSECSGACASAWPPVMATGKPVAGTGLDAAMIGTTTRSDGKTQVTYNGHPLYTYSGDQSPGDTNGQGITAFGAAWYVVAPSGNLISTPSSSASSSGSSSSSSSSGSGSGFSY